MIDWLEGVKDEQGNAEYSLDNARGKYEVQELYADGWLVLNWDADRFWLKFAVLRFKFSECDGTGVYLSAIFHGEGPTNNLRECRHTWWGENSDGYVFYPNGQIISKAFTVLSEFFDGMAC